MALTAQLAHHSQFTGAGGFFIPHFFIAFPIAPEKRVYRPLTNAIHRVEQLTLKGEAALLAIGDDFEAGAFLQGHGGVYRAVFEVFEFGGREATSGHILTGLE
jgi:hypothetical protein